MFDCIRKLDLASPRLRASESNPRGSGLCLKTPSYSLAPSVSRVRASSFLPGKDGDLSSIALPNVGTVDVRSIIRCSR